MPAPVTSTGSDPRRMEQPWMRWLPVATGVGVLLVAGVSVSLITHPTAPPLPQYREQLSEDTLRVEAREPDVIAHGQTIFRQNCTLCHGTGGQGGFGPNLRDDFWLHGSDLTRIAESIANGNPSRGMAPWQRVLSPTDLHAVAAFIASLHGSEDGTGKTKEGTRQPMTWRDTPPLPSHGDRSTP